MRLGFLIISWISMLGGGLFTIGCGEDPQTEVGFILVRPDTSSGGSLVLRDGLDRSHVVEATCEILKSDGTPEASETFDVNPDAVPGEQEVRLRGIRAGSNYFARILGLDDQGSVYECGISGPVTIRKGKKHWVEITIVTPPEEDPGCDELCKSHEDCPAGSFCPSPLTLPSPQYECIEAMNCTPALCKPFSVGAPCDVSADCGPELGCINGYGYNNGYCMATCINDEDCPQGQTWSSSCCPAALAGVAQPVCTLDCETNEDCRWGEGYECKVIDTGKLGCLPL